MKKRDKKQLLPGLLVAVAVSFLVFLYAPIDLYCSNVSEFWFDFSNYLICCLLFVCFFDLFLHYLYDVFGTYFGTVAQVIHIFFHELLDEIHRFVYSQ